MENRVLGYFVTAVEAGNISRAAMILHISQPTVSKQLKNLQDEVGVKLYDFEAKRIILTAQGRYLYNQAKQMLKIESKTLQQLKENKEMLGSVSVGSGEFEQVQVFTDLFRELQRDNPSINLKLLSMNGDSVIRDLLDGLLDFGMVSGQVNHELFESVPLSTENTWGVFVSNTNMLKEKRTIQFDDLKGERLIVSDQGNVQNLLLDWNGKWNNDMNIVAYYNLLYNASVMVKSGIGSAIGIDGVVNTENSSIEFRPLEPMLKTKVSLIWLKNSTLTTLQKNIISKLHEADRNL